MSMRPLRVAVVGAGPSGMYATGHLAEPPAGTWLDGRLVRLSTRPVEVDVLDRLPSPWGLVRNGVAPDHQAKKLITRVFDEIASRPGVRFFGNVEVGKDLTVDELLSWYDAVVFAVGPSRGRGLSVPGSGLPGSHTAHDIVAWYNGHPDHDDAEVDLSHERAVVIGNGNVALDVARVLSLAPDELGRTDAGSGALAALHHSRIREVVVVGRRGPGEAAFTNPELEELLALPDIDVRIPDGLGARMPDTHTGRRRARLLGAARERTGDGRRTVTLRFGHTPVRLEGNGRVEAIVLAGGDGTETTLPAGLVVAAIGYATDPVPGLPYDAERLVIPHLEGRVAGLGRGYVTGWAKRGPSGVIGTNKWCARETVRSLFADDTAGLLANPTTLDADTAAAAIGERCTEPVDWQAWRRIDRREVAEGRDEGRPRVKATSRRALLTYARTP